MKKTAKSHCKYSTIWHFFVLLIVGAIIAGGTIYIFKMNEINYLEKQISSQEMQLKNMEIAKYKKEIDKYKKATTTPTTTGTTKNTSTKK